MIDIRVFCVQKKTEAMERMNFLRECRESKNRLGPDFDGLHYLKV